MTDQQTRTAAAAVTRWLRDRDPGTDDEVAALELIAALRGLGWRPTEARPAADWRRPRGAAPPATEEYRRIRAETETRDHPLGWGLRDGAA